jgi:hypothetical protein
MGTKERPNVSIRHSGFAPLGDASTLTCPYRLKALSRAALGRPKFEQSSAFVLFPGLGITDLRKMPVQNRAFDIG